MVYVFAGVGALFVLMLGGLAALMAIRAGKLTGQLRLVQNDLAQAQVQASSTRGQLLSLQAHSRDLEPKLMTLESQNRELGELSQALKRQLAAASEKDTEKAGWLDHQQQEIDWLRAELEKRPKVTRKTYKILTLGVKWTGKTSLTLKWANPLTDLGAIQGTKIERYERTVSQVITKDLITEHVFEIGDWGGEHIVDAQQELIVDEIHGMLIVVDLGGKDAKTYEPARIQEQLREFQPESLKFFFGPKTVASCKALVLFINKSDLLSGTPAEAEQQAKQLYAKLINDLMRFQMQVDIRVFVGSSTYGHSTHLLFSHFVERILPKNAYDNQLLQRMKAEAPPRAPKPALPAAPTAPLHAAPNGANGAAALRS
ncbi:MAG: GTPase domain-containing protein [Byssovorax sp.]